MVEIVNPKITILQDNEYYLLFVGTMLLVFLTVTLYFSRYIYKKKYNVVNLDTKKDFVTPNIAENKPIVLKNGLISCPKGKCSMDKVSGLKKCPNDPQGIVFFNDKTEVCVSKNSCTDPLKYAVNSDGSVNKDGVCETGLDGCRCVSDVICPVYVTTKFSVANGNLFSTFASEKNYIINKIPFTDENVYQGSLRLEKYGEYCKLNSTYTGKILNGCSFENSSKDFLMDCDKESFQDNTSVSPYSLVPYTTDPTIKKQFCETQGEDDSNWNNMTLCMSKEVCTEGNLTYNFDIYRKNSIYRQVDNIQIDRSSSNIQQASNVNTVNFLDSRRFCQSYASDLNTYLTDLQYYTLSCIRGTKCNKLPKARDIGKFFVGENNEFDPAGIFASFPVEIRVPDESTPEKINISYSGSLNLGYDPVRYMLNDGDIIGVVGDDTSYYLLADTRITSSAIDATLYNLNQDNLPTVYTDTITGEITYFPQFALNGFGYNTIPYISRYNDGNDDKVVGYRISDIYKTNVDGPKPTNTENTYIPIFSILKEKTFFRGGLSKPQGYVAQNLIQEVEVEEQIDIERNKSSDSWSIKKTPFDTSLYDNISMYYSVWNNNYGRTECIRCGPLLVASVNMARVAGSNVVSSFIYDAVTIQYSGKDFGHYRNNLLTKQLTYTSTGTISSNPKTPSATRKLTLNKPNFNIEIGDFVISSNSEFDYFIKPTRTLSPNFNKRKCTVYLGNVTLDSENNITRHSKFIFDGSPKLGKDDNFYEDFDLSKTQTATGHYDFIKNVINLENIPNLNFMFGNRYRIYFSFQEEVTNSFNETLFPFFDPITETITQTTRENIDKFFEGALIPKNRVTAIDNTRRIITTDSDNIVQLPSDSKVQFISSNRFLELENDISVVMPFNPVGSGAKISVRQITDGRITSIKVDQPGTGYTNVSPRVMFKTYDQYLLAERDSNYQNKFN